MTFDLYNSQTPQSPDCRTSKKCSGDIGVSEKNSVENSPWGGGKPLLAHSLIVRECVNTVPCYHTCCHTFITPVFICCHTRCHTCINLLSHLYNTLCHCHHNFITPIFTCCHTCITPVFTCSRCFDQPSSRDISWMTRGNDSSAARTLRNANLVRRARTSTAVSAYS